APGERVVLEVRRGRRRRPLLLGLLALAALIGAAAALASTVDLGADTAGDLPADTNTTASTATTVATTPTQAATTETAPAPAPAAWRSRACACGRVLAVRRGCATALGGHRTRLRTAQPRAAARGPGARKRGVWPLGRVVCAAAGPAGAGRARRRPRACRPLR